MSNDLHLKKEERAGMKGNGLIRASARKDWRKHYLQMKLRICISFASAFSVQLEFFHQLVDDGKKEKKGRKLISVF